MVLRVSNTPFVCLRCLSRQTRRFSSHVSNKAPPSPPPSGAARLTNRRLIHLQGQDAAKFLQGITTNNVRVDSRSGFYAAFLTAQGKVLHDTFIYSTQGSTWHKQQLINGGSEDGFLVEVDFEQADLLLKHMKRHKLRSKFKLRLLEERELDVWSLWREGNRWTAHGKLQNTDGKDEVICLTDCRAPGMGQRLLLPQDDQALLGDVEEAPLSSYTIRRLLRGVAEGQKEMPRDDCLPMNCNIDIMGGIDFKKGCYIGQELTIRTHHTGVIRRRILPIMVFEQGTVAPENLEYDPSSTANIVRGTELRKDDKRKRSTGKLLTSCGNIGLGMCRLEQMTDLVVSGEISSYTAEDRFIIESVDGDSLGLKVFVPDWIRGSIRAPKIQKRVE